MLRKISFCLIIFFPSISFGERIIISLGIRCDSAIQLREYFSRHYNLRDAAYPFDWLISPFDGLYKCLEEDFKNFLRPDALSLYNHHPGIMGVQDNYYGFQFIHDFPPSSIDHLQISELEENPPFMGFISPNFLDYLATVQEKYARRIERFRHVLSGPHEIFFIRTTITKEQAISLHSLFRRKYPNLNFTLVAIDNTDEIRIPWGIPGIRNAYIVNTFVEGSSEWEKLFRELGLI